MEYYIVDVFSDEVFHGSQIGVCLPRYWPSERDMQKIAAENNLAATAFAVDIDGFYELRGFTPELELELCGSAVLAAAYVLFTCKGKAETVIFSTRSGLLLVENSIESEALTAELPARRATRCETPLGLESALGVKLLETYSSNELLLVVLKNEDAVRNLCPDFESLKNLRECFGVIVTAPGKDCDFVSRFFSPCAGLCEDHVTASAHSVLVPYWSRRTGKQHLIAMQLSKRGGRLLCEDCGECVKISGSSRLYLSGEINLRGGNINNA